MTPFQIRKSRLNRAAQEDALWLYRTLARESLKLGSHLALRDDFSMALLPQ